MMCNTCTFSGNLIVHLFLEKHSFIVHSYWLNKSGVPSLNVEVSILYANIPADISWSFTAREYVVWKIFRERKEAPSNRPTLNGTWYHNPLSVTYLWRWFGFMVLNATFNNISAISWGWVLLVEETEVPGENYRSVASHWQTLSHNVA